MGEGEEEGREAELELAGRGSLASHVGSAVSKAVLGAARGKPTPARSSAVPSSLPPAASSPPPSGPSSPATCCFCLENLVGGRREELLDLTPSPVRASDPCPPWSPPIPPSHLPLIFLCPSPPSVCPSHPSCLSPSLTLHLFLPEPTRWAWVRVSGKGSEAIGEGRGGGAPDQFPPPPSGWPLPWQLGRTGLRGEDKGGGWTRTS